MATMTTIAAVRNRATGYSSSPADAAITQYIEDAEAVINAASRHNWISGSPVFDASKHTLLVQIARDLAAFWVVASDPAVSTTNAEAALMMDAFWGAAMHGLSLLSDERIITYLKGL